jgi:hypothetical protein
MKIVISEYGLLYLERAGTLREMVCPFAHGQTSCGDWCPLFGESAEEGTLDICQETRLYGDIEDRRKVTP